MSDVTRSLEHDAKLTAFIVESNHIEGIHRPPTPEEVKAHKALLARKTVTIELGFLHSFYYQTLAARQSL